MVHKWAEGKFYLYLYGLFNNTVSSSDCIVSISKVICGYWKWMEQSSHSQWWSSFGFLHPEDGGSVFLRNTARCLRSENPESLRNDFAALLCIPTGQTVWGIFRRGFPSFGTRYCVVGWMVSDVSNESGVLEMLRTARCALHRYDIGAESSKPRLWKPQIHHIGKFGTGGAQNDIIPVNLILWWPTGVRVNRNY